MFVIGFLNKQNKTNMSFNQDINFHRVMSHGQLKSTRHTHQHPHRYSSPQRLQSCPNGANQRFISPQTGSNLSLNSVSSSSDTSDHRGETFGPCTEEGGLHFSRDQSLQSSFNSDRSNESTESGVNQGSSDSSHLSSSRSSSSQQLQLSSAYFQFDQADNNNNSPGDGDNQIELQVLENGKAKKSYPPPSSHHHKKKKTKKISKSTTSGSSNSFSGK